MLNSLERNLSGLSEYNIKFFSLNFKLLWLRDNWMKNKAISKKGSSEIIHWSPDEDDIWIPDLRIDTSIKILKDIGESQLQQEFTEDDNKKRHAKILELKGYYDYIHKKIRSIYFQSTAQQCIIKGNVDEAFNNLSEALKLEDYKNGWDKEECLKWINKLKGGIEK